MTNDQFTQLNQRLDSIEQRLEEGFSRPASLVLDEVLALEQRTNERLDRLTEQVERLVDGQQELQSSIRQLIQVMFESSRDADADREQMRELQSEVRGLQAENRRILDYLFNQQNGEGR